MKRLLLSVVLFSSLPALACHPQLKHLEVRDAKGRSLGVAKIREYLPVEKRRKARAVLFAPTGGETPFEKLYALDLCQAGILAQVIVEVPESQYGLLDVRMHNEFLQLARDTVSSLLGRDRTPVAIIGTSLGGFAASSVIAAEPRIKVAVLIATGLDVPNILAHSNHRKAEKQARVLMKRHGLETVEEYEDFLEQHMPLAPSKTLPRARSLPTSLHIVMTNDKTVSTESQWALKGAFPRPEWITVHTSHMPGIVRTGLSLREEIADFISTHMPR